jgi:hypothetical protein
MPGQRTEERPVYTRSGRVEWFRFLPAAVVTLLVAAAMAYCWFLLYDVGHGYWLATAVLTALPVALSAYLAVAFGHCRNRAVAGALGVMATLVFQLGYFHADMVRQKGPETLLSFDQLPEFIGNRMANDRARLGFMPRGELYNWFYSAVELLTISLFVIGAPSYRSQKAYCESCRRWMRSVAFHAKAGRGDDIADALETEDWSDMPVIAGRAVKIAGAQSWVEFEYCPNVRDPESECVAYLSLKEHPSATENPEELLKQGLLERHEVNALADHVAPLAWLRVSAPTASTDEPAAGRSIDRHVGAVAAVERLPDSAGGADFDRAGKYEFLLGLMTVGVPLAGIGLIVWGMVRAPWNDSPPGSTISWLMVGTGLIAALAGGLVCWVNVDLIGVRYIRGRIGRIIAERADSVVSADDPGARFIDIVPREQWHQLVPDKAIDRGLLRFDPTGRRILFEGMKERYVIPADAVLTCEVERMLPTTGNWNFFAVVLTVSYSVSAPAPIAGGRRDEEWEVPLLPRSTRFRRYNSAYRRELAESLRDEIEDFVDEVPRNKEDES